MATYRLDYTFEHEDLVCRDCIFWRYDDVDGWCRITCTHECSERGFDIYEGRLSDCPLTEVVK